jgi:hypothetical protein
MKTLFELSGIRRDEFLERDGAWIHTPTGTRFPVIRGGTPVNYAQEAFRFNNDDGGVDAGTQIAAVNNDINRAPGTANKFRLRIVVQMTVAKLANNDIFDIRVQKNSTGGFVKVTTTSSNVRLVDDGNSIADKATTTQIIGDGTYVVGDSEGWNDGTTDDNTGNIDFVGNDEVELEFCLYIVTADVNDGDTLDFEVYHSDGTALNSYPDDPRATVTKGPEASVSDSVTTGESVTVSNPTDFADVADAVTVTDNFSTSKYVDQVIVGEWVSVEVTTAGIGDLDINVSDSVTTGETATLDNPQLGDISETDAVTTGESVTARLEIFITETDAVATGDTATITPLVMGGVDVSDAVSVTDTPTLDPLELAGISELDTVTTGETATLDLPIDITETDAVTTGDTATITPLVIDIDEAEAVTVTDTPSVSIPSIDEHSISVSDSVTTGESTTIDPLVIDITETDAVTTGESQNVSITSIGEIDVNVSDAVTLGDTASLDPLDLVGISVSDSVTLGDTATLDLPITISALDTVAAAESVTITPIAIPGVNVSDSVTTGESTNISLTVFEAVLSISALDTVGTDERLWLSVDPEIIRPARLGVRRLRYDRLNRIGKPGKRYNKHRGPWR